MIKNYFHKAYFENVLHDVLNSNEFHTFKATYPGYTPTGDQLITCKNLDLEEIINQATVNDLVLVLNKILKHTNYTQNF